MRDIRIAPSMLAADFWNLEESIGSVSNADLIHFDVMDGHYVPDLSFGPVLARSIASHAVAPLDIHLMVDNPEAVLEWYLLEGVASVTVHIEAATHIHRLIERIKAAEISAGVALNPGTPVHALDAVLDDVDMVLVMTVDPGCGGQPMIPGSVGKVAAVRELCERHGVEPSIEVDGGVSRATIGELANAGASVFVAGSAVFKSGDPRGEVDALRERAIVFG